MTRGTDTASSTVQGRGRLLASTSRATAFLVSLWLFFCASTPASSAGPPATFQDKVAPIVPLRAEPFPLQNVRLSQGPFRHAMELDLAYLLSLDPDRLLYSFRLNAGLPSTAKPYGGWMTPGRVSCAEFVGHYLSACALMYASTGDERLRQKANLVVAGFGQCQDSLGTGYLHTKPDNFSTQGQAPLGLWYQIHKILAGLMEVYVNCHNQQALDIACKLADWAKTGADRLSDQQMQDMLAIEQGGINEALANLYALTAQDKYLHLALRFNHLDVIGPASRHVDNLTGKHANTQIPKFVGAARQYELTGQDWLKTASAFFWDTVVHERSYVIGGNSFAEFFSPKETLSQALGSDTCETCNTYNMLKLTRHLFCWDPRAEYADFYERALYNHILASQNPSNGMMCYFLPLAFGAKQYSTPEDSFWCCTGTGIENHAKYGDSIYFHHGNSVLFVNLFIASELHWPAPGISLRQETSYPDEGRTRLTFTCQKPTQLRLCIRHPYWAASGFDISIDGVRQPANSQPASYAVLDRTWQTGDTVEVTMPFSLRTEGFRDNPRRFAFMYGPLVLCARTTGPTLYEAPCPALVADDDQWTAGLEPVPGKPDAFTASARVLRLDAVNDHPVTLEPIHLEHGDRSYVVYWNVLTPSQWQADDANSRALQARIVDRVLPGNDQNERDHQVRGDRTGTGDPGWRHAVDGGWFSWQMSVLPRQPQELRVKYWGSDTGGREFDIFVDAEKLTTQILDNNRPGEFYETTYPLPDRLTQGKAKVTVKFQAHPDKIAGGVFGCAISRIEPKGPTAP
ncbi:MAG: beta-L-arabinofuranosidase domain-containing protein [Verrucomicrobiota bacterium]